MKTIRYQLLVNTKRLLLRNKRSVFFSLIFPLFFYVLYSSVFTFPMAADALIVWQKDYLVSMAIYGVLMTSVVTVANALLMDHVNHFDLFVELSPTSNWRYILTVVLVYIPFYFLLVFMLGAIAFFVNGVTLSLIEWLGLLIIILFTMIPFSLIGVLVSLAQNSTAVNVISNLITFPLAILGGLWWPIEIMPSWIQTIGKTLPTYQVAQLSQQWIHEHTIDWEMLGLILLWTLFLAGLIYIIKLLMKRKEPQLI